MKRILSIVLLIVLLVLVNCTKVFAASPQVLISGDDKAKSGETKEITIKVSSDTEIGVVSGKIEANSNISNVTVTGKNGWNLTYNQNTGVFNIYKAEGAKSEEIMTIQYKAGNAEGTGTIVLSNVKATTISYESKDIGSITKTIEIANEKTEEKQETDEEENQERKEEEEQEQEQNQEKEQEINKEQEQKVNKEQEQKQQETNKEQEQKKQETNKEKQQTKQDNKKDTTVKENKELPNTGASKNIYILVSVMVVINLVIGIWVCKNKIK